MFCGCATVGEPGTPAAVPSDERLSALLAGIREQLVRIPAGRFTMGSASGTGEDEHPAREVFVRSFHLARVEVTAAQYAVFADATGRTAAASSGESHPAVNVSWDDARAFIEWLNALGGDHYRLPTEAEWEYAARAGTTTTYWWGDTFDAELLNGTGVHGKDRWLETAPVGQFPPNDFGLQDMLGNVWEWTADCYYPNYEGAPTDSSARSGEAACGRVLRGGSWSDRAEWLRLAARNWFDATDRFDYVGLRLAHD